MKTTANGDNQFAYPTPYFLILATLLSGVFQVFFFFGGCVMYLFIDIFFLVLLIYFWFCLFFLCLDSLDQFGIKEV